MFKLFIALMMSLFGLSLGTSIGANRKESKPTVLDLIWVVLLWATVFLLRPIITAHWYTLLGWLVTVTILALIQAKIRYASVEADEPPDPAQFANMNPFTKLWERWKIFSMQIGHFQSLLIMAFFYFVIALPFGVGARLFSDQLGMKTMPETTGWHERKPLSTSLEDNLNQY